MLHVTGVLYFHCFLWVLLPRVQCILSIPPGPWAKMKWVKDHDRMNSLVILRLVCTRRWVLALQLPSIWLLSVQFNLHSALTWPVSIALALGGRYVSFTLDSPLSADTVRWLQSETYTWKRNPSMMQHTSYECGLYMLKCMFTDASLCLTGNRSGVSTWDPGLRILFNVESDWLGPSKVSVWRFKLKV